MLASASKMGALFWISTQLLWVCVPPLESVAVTEHRIISDMDTLSEESSKDAEFALLTLLV